MNNVKPVRRVLSFMVAFALVVGLVVPAAPAGAVANGWSSLPWSNSDITPDPRLTQSNKGDSTIEYKDSDVVRVSIVLEDASVLDRGFSTVGISQNTYASAYRNSLEMKQESIEQKIESQVLSGKSLDVVWNLTLAANIISANVEYGEIDAIKAVPGVKDVVLETLYSPAVADTDLPVDPNMSTSSGQIGSELAWAGGYTGAGSKVAIVDTGIDIDHQSFDPDAFLHAISEVRSNGTKVDLMDASDIDSVLKDLNIVKRGDYTGGATGLYKNSKVPYAFNYVDGNNTDITHDNDDEGEHGSHVSGIVAGNRYIPDKENPGEYTNALESVLTQGVAPDAQLLVMKVFGTSGGAYDSDYMAAIEDAMILGADSVNLSLGSAMAGYSRSETYEAILDKIATTDTVLTISMGNSGYWAQNLDAESSTIPYPYLLGDDVNFSTGGSPGSYTNAFTVGSVDNIGQTGYYVKVGDSLIFYSDTAANYPGVDPFISLASDDPYTYVFFDAYGKVGDFDGVDLEGKIAVCWRGEKIDFTDKIARAVAAGARAVIVANNVEGTINMDLTNYGGSNPAVTISLADASKLIEAADSENTTEKGITYYEGTLTVSSEVAADNGVISPEGIYTVSDFSSWGIPGSLEMKPEIMAPGGNIYSVDGSKTSGDAYENMSGTSMAAPQVSGMAAVVAQYIRQNPDKFANSKLTRRGLVNSLLMSTAKPVMEDYGEDYGYGYYSILAQGAGLANVGSAVHAQNYIIMDAKANSGAEDGKVKVELGDDPDKNGKYEFSFTIHNTSGTENVYTLDTDLFTQDTFPEAISETEATLFLDTWTRSIEFSETYLVNGKPFDPEARIDADVNNDGYTNDADAQAVLDLLAGKITNEGLDLEAADVDGDNEVTTYDAHLILKGVEARLTVPANGEVNVTVKLEITEDFSAYADGAYENGAYIEGFTYVLPVASEEGELDEEYSIPILGFYGNWSDASMFDRVDIEDYFYGDDEDKLGYTGQITDELDYRDGADRNEYYLFGNPYVNYPEESENVEYHPEREALKSIDTLTAYYYTLIRNAGARAIVIYNSADKPVYVSAISSEYAAFYYTNQGSWQYTSSAININAPVSAFDTKENEAFTVKMYAVPEYYLTDEMYADGVISDEELYSVLDMLGSGACVSKTITVDDTAPEFVSDPMKNLVTNDLSITVKDNQYIAYAAVLSRSGAFSYATIIDDDMDQTPGEEFELVFKGEDLADARQYVTIAVFDYAGNMSVIEVKYGDPVNVAGEMFGFSSGIYTNNRTGEALNTWLKLDPETVNLWDDMGYELYDVSDVAVSAAEYIDGYSFQADADGVFYVAPQSDPGYTKAVTAMKIAPIDMAYDYTRNELYALTADNEVYTVEPLTGIAELAFTLSGTDMEETVAGMAIDSDGTFYFSGTYLYVLEDWDGSNDTVTVEQRSESLPTASTTLAWDSNEDILYLVCEGESLDLFGIITLAYHLCTVNTETGETEGNSSVYDSLLMAPFTALYVVPASGDDIIDDTPTDKVSTIVVSPEEESIMVGGSVQLTAYVSPWTLEDSTVTWESSDNKVATVDSTGYVKAVDVGTATITATSVADPEKKATATITVLPLPEYELEGLIYDNDSEAYWSSFNTSDVASFEHEAQGQYFYAGALADDGVIYAHDGTSIYAIDPNTFSARYLYNMNPLYLFPDAALNRYFAAITAGDVALLAPQANSGVLLILLPESGKLYTADLSSNLSANIAAITWTGMTQDGRDFYYILLENGDLYQLILTYIGGISLGLVGNIGLDITGAANPDGSSSASLTYDFINGDDYTEYLYLSHYADNDDTAYLSVIEINFAGDSPECKTMASVPFGDNVWPVVSLINSVEKEVFATASHKDNNVPMTVIGSVGEAMSIVADTENANAISAPETAKAAPLASLNSVKVDGTTDESGKKQYNVIDTDKNTVTVTVSVEDSTNGLLSLEYDKDLFKLESVTGLTTYNSYASADGNIVFDYAAAEKLTQQVVTFVFSYEEEDEIWIDTVITVTTTEDGEPSEEAPSVEEIPIKVTHDHKLKHNAKVEATCTETGVIEYWECELCGLKFSDEGITVVEDKDLVIPAKGHDFTKEVVSDETLRTPANHHEAATYFYTCSACGEISTDKYFTSGDPLAYNVTADNSTWNENDETGLAFKTDGESEFLDGVKVDGVLVSDSSYTVDTKTMTITLTPEFLKTLAEGEHTLTVEYKDGEASVKFNVVKAVVDPSTPTPPATPSIPETGDGESNGLWLAFAGTLAMAFAVIGVIVIAGKSKKRENA